MAILTYLLTFIALFALILVYFRIADRFNIIDKPNQRSSHSRITLRGGGVVFYFGVLLWFFWSGFAYPWFFAGLTLIAFISFADDVKPQPSKLRLSLHFLAMLLMFYQWDLFHMPWYYTLFALIISTGIINAYNFMDGINGITGGYSLVVLGALWYINTFQTEFTDNRLLYTLLLSLLVFNFFNFRKRAKCFAGDVGAISIAFTIVFLLGLLMLKTGDLSYILLLGVYGVDSILTIVHRIILRENIFEAHRKHAYQLMANELKIPHVVVSAIYMLLQAVTVAGYLLVQSAFRWHYTAAVLALLGIGYILFKRKYFKLHLLQNP
jgi:UDP-N-acetylmuramyl pentapeptide phosphotransferase/UDP-N-acetylglucosamine-1-phosphate transferase